MIIILDIEEFIDIKWAKATKKYYINLGYSFTFIGDYFNVKIKDLPKGSHAIVYVTCDNCGNKVKRVYKDHIVEHDEMFGDLCKKCYGIKAKNVLTSKYGGCGFKSETIREKSTKTNLIRYDSEFPLGNKEINKKGQETQIKKYGGIGMGSDITRSKIEETNIKIRGVKNPSQDDCVKEKKKNTFMERYGVEYSFGIPEIASQITEKARKTLHSNGSVPISKMEIEICNILKEIYGENKCFPSYLYKTLTFDCLLILGSNKIDIEYDGWYWHKDNQEKDRKRNYWVLKEGYKVLRIKSNRELPTKEQIIKAIDYLVDDNHSFTEIILDI